MNVTENLNWHIHICSLCAILSKIYYFIYYEISYDTSDLLCLLSVVNEIWYYIQGEGQG